MATQPGLTLGGDHERRRPRAGAGTTSRTPAAALSSNNLQRNRVVIQPEFRDDLPTVTGDRVQLQQVILNLLRNAVDAMADVDDRPRLL